MTQIFMISCTYMVVLERPDFSRVSSHVSFEDAVADAIMMLAGDGA